MEFMEKEKRYINLEATIIFIFIIMSIIIFTFITDGLDSSMGKNFRASKLYLLSKNDNVVSISKASEEAIIAVDSTRFR